MESGAELMWYNYSLTTNIKGFDIDIALEAGDIYKITFDEGEKVYFFKDTNLAKLIKMLEEKADVLYKRPSGQIYKTEKI